MSDDYAGPGVPTFGPPLAKCDAPGCEQKVIYLGLCWEHAEEEVGPASPTTEDLVGPL